MNDPVRLSECLAAPFADDHVVCLEPQRTWRDLLCDVTGFGEQLPHGGDKRVLLAVESPYLFAAAFLACLQNKVTAVAVADLQPGALTELVPQLAAVVSDSNFRLADLPTIAPNRAEAVGPFAKPSRDQTALFLYTSGSSGDRKLIPKKLFQIEDELLTLEQVWGATTTKRLRLATVSHRHIYGLLFRLLWPLCAGAPFSNRNYFFWEELAAAAPSAGCVVVSSPTHLHHLGNLQATVILPADTLLFSSGGPLAETAACHIAQNQGAAPIEVYGSTETGGVAWRQRRPSEPDPAWTPLPGVITQGEAGRLVLQSPFIDSKEGWYRTDDLAVFGDVGEFRLAGRCDRLVKIGEKRVSLNEVEQRLLDDAAFTAVKCFAMGETRRRLVLVGALSEQGFALLLSEGRRPLNQRVKSLLRDYLEPALIPKHFRWVRDLPTNNQGKTPQFLLETLFEHEAIDPTRANRMPHFEAYQQREGKHHFEAQVPSDLLYLDGHFPDAQVVAGVVQVTWVVRLIQALNGRPLDVAGMEAIKFRGLLRPEQRFSITLQDDEARGKWRFQLQGEAGLISSGRLCKRAE